MNIGKSKNYLIFSLGCPSAEVRSDCTDQLDQFNAEDVMAILQRLPDLLRVVFNMYELDGYSHKEIASNLRITESTSRAYLTRAKAKLRELFTKSLPYEY
jgi:RNA polymerase sigma factor (sigma-70 family)